MKYDALITHALELLAAIAGFYYLRRFEFSKLRAFVYFLAFTVFIEAIGSYTSLITVFDFLKPIQETIFIKNLWLYNLYVMGSLFFYLIFYRKMLRIAIHKQIVSILIYSSIPFIIINVYNNNIFDAYLKYNFLWTTFSVFVCVSLYFYEILMSDDILRFYKLPMFYISSGLLVWWLIFPLMIFYMPYYKPIYPEVIKFRAIMMIGTNAIMYGLFTIGFLKGEE